MHDKKQFCEAIGQVLAHKAYGRDRQLKQKVRVGALQDDPKLCAKTAVHLDPIPRSP